MVRKERGVPRGNLRGEGTRERQHRDGTERHALQDGESYPDHDLPTLEAVPHLPIIAEPARAWARRESAVRPPEARN